MSIEKLIVGEVQKHVEEGRFAYETFKQLEDNPYEEGSIEFHAWNKGWLDLEAKHFGETDAYVANTAIGELFN